ncbi:MTRF1L release factor glutamine methyltransferase [Nasonia vitripennis]|uniref:peptide chain release factor N(5)-glutamine methyltransferase n=1 Tax=Nasonia vitripennis TaxID=7425 RepID=A0A7M7HC61_NASVI|nr:MTRF1L release factor glutamine methyltransferase [Nasonia vitripennis]
MLPLKVLKKSASCSNLLSTCLKCTKDIAQPPSPAVFQASCHEAADHPVGPLNVLSTYWKHRFETEGVSQPMESIEHIIAHVIKDKEAKQRESLDDMQLEKLKLLCNRRLSKMPLEYCTEESDFRDTKLKLSAPIFIPERQTEILVDLLLKHVDRSCSKICHVLEIGCGAGAISLSLLRSCKCNSVQVVAIDTNMIACQLTLHNAKNLGLEDCLTILHATLESNGEIVCTSNLSNDRVFDLQEETFDFIVSNPPCVPTSELPKWQKEYEDYQARNGGKDGLRVIRPLLMYASKRLKKDGILLMEVLPQQTEQIRSLTEKQYPLILKFDHVYKDLSNDERVVEISKIG